MFLLFLATASMLLFPNVPMIESNETSFIAVLVLIVQAVLNLMLLLRTLTRATSIAGRERTSAWNWEAFVLTAVDADTVIIGKWAAVVQKVCCAGESVKGVAEQTGEGRDVVTKLLKVGLDLLAVHYGMMVGRRVR